MTYRYVETGILSDIANAVRARNGETKAYKPHELGAAVLALGGTISAAGATYPPHELPKGLVRDSVFKEVARALRFHSLGARRYRPCDMAAAIAGLEFEQGLKVRALLHDSGVLELNYHDVRKTDLASDVCAVYVVKPSGYADAASVPWSADALQIREVRVHDSMMAAGVADVSYWFCGCANLVAVYGFQYLFRARAADGLFEGCTKLDSVFAEPVWWDFVTYKALSATEGLPFEGCIKLVGNDGKLVSGTASCSALTTESGGVLVSEERDTRRFFQANLYAGGTLTLTPHPPSTQYELLACGRLCSGVAYASAKAMPWHGFEERLRSVQFKRGMSFYSLCWDWWFAGCNAIQGFRGLELAGTPVSARFAFADCDGLSSLVLTGLDASALCDTTGMFRGCSNLRRIAVDADWALGGACVGTDVFEGCMMLVGGNGTAYSPDATGVEMMTIDTAGQTGYLSASQ